ncbi:MAG TPA: hypothetical protein VGX46_02600 [Vicinamibacterales bacterium]|jgi:hypothetical protein|nr:hypothetical protein [Vicinamibacterales bacterium]
MSPATKSFLVGAAIGVAGSLAYLTPAIAQQTLDLDAVFHRLHWHSIGPASNRRDAAPGVPGDPKGIHRRQSIDGPFNGYRRA